MKPFALRCCSVLATAVFAVLAMASGAHAQWRGHGGPVRALAVSPDGASVVSGSFDTSAIRWSPARNAAEQVLRFHDGAVNAVAGLKDGRLVTSGEDARIAIWTAGEPQPSAVLEGHTAPVVAVAASPDGKWLASASWDRSVRLWRTDAARGGGGAQVLEGHQQNVNGVAFTADGRALVSAGYDATVRIWPLDAAGASSGAPLIAMLPSPLNAALVAGGEIVAAGADGKLYFLGLDGAVRGEFAVGAEPITALAASGDGTLLAAAGLRGAVALVDRPGRSLARMLAVPGPPVWSLAFLADDRTLLTGGGDRLIRRWDAATGAPLDTGIAGGPEDGLAAYAADPGAQVFRACVACHTLRPDEGNRAGPTLAGIFGRRIASLPGYNFSEALKRLDIVWTPDSVAKMFEVGPAAFTPGTKMPEQRIGSPEERAALVQFLEKATGARQ